MTVTITLGKEAPEGAVRVTGVSAEALGSHTAQAFLIDGDFEAKAGEYRVMPVEGGVEVVATKVVGRQVEGLHVGAERAVVDDDALADEVEEGG